jgi:hypothetical protein
MRILHEMVGFHEDVDRGFQAWEDRNRRLFLDSDSACYHPNDYALQFQVGSWMNLAEHAALGAHWLILDDVTGISDSEQPEKDQVDGLEGMHASHCDSRNQARLINEQAEELGCRAKAPSRVWRTIHRGSPRMLPSQNLSAFS